MFSDIRLGFRSFRRHWWLAAAAVTSIALGIGANTAIFSVLHAVVLNPLPYAAPDRLVIVWETSPENATRWVAPANFVDWRRDSRAFASLAAFDAFSPTFAGSGGAERLRALGVSGTFFTMLGASAALGRTLLATDDAADADAVAVLSDAFWRRTFGAEPVAGRSIVLDGLPYTIVGVMPSAFRSPLDQAGVDVWVNGDRGVPRTFPFGTDVTTVRDAHTLSVAGRLAEGVTRDVAQQELGALMAELARRYPDTNTGLGVNVVPMHEAEVGDTRPLLTLLQVAVGIMLLIACANVAHLLLVRAAGRQGEIATRLALGAPRRRLLRQLAGEALAIAIPGGVLGLLVAAVGVRAVVQLAPDSLPRVAEIGLDATVVMFAVLITIVTALVFGLGPALQTTKVTALAETSHRVAGVKRVKTWHHAIVVLELALAQVLLVGAALLLTSFVASQRVPLGFAIEGRVAADLNLSPDRYLSQVGGFRIDPAAKLQFVDAVLAAAASAPGVRAVGASFTSPLSGAPNRGITIVGRPTDRGALGDAADFQLITPDFFRAAGMTLVRGRTFDSSDRADTTPVAIVNQTFVDRYFASGDALGKRFTYGRDHTTTIVGVVADARYRNIEMAADPTFFLPITQNDERWPFLSFTAWTDGDERALVGALRDAVRRADPNQAVTRVLPYTELTAEALAPRRFNTMLVLLFAGAALLLAAVGTYGVMAYAVSMRTRELGLRAALGASPRDLLRLILRQGLVVTSVAVAAGLVTSVLSTQLMAAMLFGVEPTDGAVLAGVAALLAGVALVATWIPARHAVSVSPLSALRE